MKLLSSALLALPFWVGEGLTSSAEVACAFESTFDIFDGGVLSTELRRVDGIRMCEEFRTEESSGVNRSTFGTCSGCLIYTFYVSSLAALIFDSVATVAVTSSSVL